MSEQVAAPAPVPVPAIAPTVPAIAEQAPAAPAIPDDLRASMAAHTAKYSQAEPPKTNTDLTLGEVAANALITERANAAKTEGTEAAKVDPAAEPAKEPESRSEVLAKFIRMQRQTQEQQRAIAAERVQLKQQQEAATKALQEAEAGRTTLSQLEELKAKDPAGYILKALGPKAFEEGGLIVELLNRIGNGSTEEPAKQLTEEERADLVAKLAAKKVRDEIANEEKARKDAQDAETVKRQAASREAFFVGMAEDFSAKAEKYPYLAADPAPVEEVDAWFKANARPGAIPTNDQIFAHFDGLRKAKAEKLIAAFNARQGTPQAPVTRSRAADAPVPAAERFDSRGRAPVPAKGRLAFEEERNATRERLAALDRAGR